MGVLLLGPQASRLHSSGGTCYAQRQTPAVPEREPRVEERPLIRDVEKHREVVADMVFQKGVALFCHAGPLREYPRPTLTTTTRRC